MKIVIVGQYYWPENFLINDIAEELVARGHNVSVLTGLPDYATSIVPAEYRHGKNRDEIRNGVVIHRVPIIARRHGFFFRVLNYLSFWVTSSVYAATHRYEADVIMAYQTAPIFMGAGGIVLKKKLKKPLFFYCLDIWPDQMKIWGVNEKNPIFSLVKKYCQHAYGSGDLVGITSRPFRQYLIDVNKVDDKKIVYLPQHSEKIEVGEDIDRTDKESVDFVFAGNIGQQQNIECILKAVSKMHSQKPYHIHIYGNGTSYESCKELATELKINDKVTFYGRVSKDELKEIYPKMDAFLLTLCPESKVGFVANTVPAKLQGYMSAGKPIIASVDGGAKEIIEECQCGIAVPADDIDAYAEAITEFIENIENYRECGTRAKKYFEENFDKKVVMDKLENYLFELAKGKTQC
ncbi:MAG: glycosyltransferase family 4 protein [Oscillospiraceae bacterium]|nr:glycosyltransferase family 4 protein [Oscillospiraceae bacterium]